MPSERSEVYSAAPIAAVSLEASDSSTWDVPFGKACRTAASRHSSAPLLS